MTPGYGEREAAEAARAASREQRATTGRDGPEARVGLLLLGLAIAVAACGAEAPPAVEPPPAAPSATTSEAAAISAGSGSEVGADGLPTPIDPAVRHLLYLHGAIVEGENPRPVHPEWGVYRYPDIVARLGEEGLAVIAEQRPAGADVEIWGERVARQVERLIAAGVPPAGVTVVGASKGGVIALMAASRIAHPDVRYVLLGACGSERAGAVRGLVGRFLSLVEESDTIGTSCRPLFAANPAMTAAEERVLRTGRHHGFLYEPRPEWVEPTLAWARAAPD